MAAEDSFCDPVKCCPCFYSDEDRLSRNINKKIDFEMKKYKQNAKKEIKLLLLGIGEAGKSTVIKQMQIIHGDGFKDKEKRREYIKSIHENISESIQILLSAMKDLNVSFGNEKVKKYADLFRKEVAKAYDPDMVSKMFEAVEVIWNDEGVRECYRRRREFLYVYLSDSAGYFLDKLKELSDPDYLPTEEDILKVRKSTTGVQEYSFKIRQVVFRIVDVGGQRTERRKWIHCFENVTSIIFVASLADYDQLLLSDDSRTGEEQVVNRLEESIALFDVVIHERFLQTAAIILFLNKTDVFDDKIKERHMEDFFPKYSSFQPSGQQNKGPKKDAKAGKEFILKMYIDYVQAHMDKPEHGDKEAQKKRTYELEQLLYSHYTCATDTEGMRFVTKAVEDYIIRISLINFHLT